MMGFSGDAQPDVGRVVEATCAKGCQHRRMYVLLEFGC